jgi:mono/diheme cytochrome c family protein
MLNNRTAKNAVAWLGVPLAVSIIVAGWRLDAQTSGNPAPSGQAGRGGRGGGPGGFGAFPERPAGDPAAIARGKALYETNCGFCHGADARGGEEGGPNLLRSEVLMKDQRGETLAPVVLNGRTDKGMPKFSMTEAQISDVSAFIHSFRLSSRDPGRMRPPNIVVGDANAGEAYFKSKCASCHSVTGDLKGIAGRITDARMLQQTWLMPVVYGGRGAATGAVNVPPVTVTVTLADGRKVDGRLGRIDDFIVTLTQPDGTARSFRRDGDVPRVEVHDPMQPHKDLLRVYTDKNIHDVTAYLVTIK